MLIINKAIVIIIAVLCVATIACMVTTTSAIGQRVDAVGDLQYVGTTLNNVELELEGIILEGVEL